MRQPQKITDQQSPCPSHLCEQDLPQFFAALPYHPVRLPEPFPKTQVTRRLAVNFVQDLLRSLTSTWLLGDKGKKRWRGMFPELDAWRDLMMHDFDEKQLRALRTAPDDYKRIAFLHLFDLILFDEVKKDLVAASGAVEKVINEFTRVRSSLPNITARQLPLVLRLPADHPCTAIELVA